MSTKVLVTGGTGFIGRHVIQRLLAAGCTVRVAVRTLDSGPLPLDPAVELFSVGDYLHSPDWVRALDGIEVVVHLAARVHVMRDTASDQLHEFRKMNRDVTTTIARTAADTGVRRFVFLSSIKVNGESTAPGRPFTVSDVPNPIDAYGLSKQEAEESLIAISKSSNMAVSILRPPLVYGPGVGGNFVRLIKLAETGWPLPMKSATNRRSILYVGNLAERVLTAVGHKNDGYELALVADEEPVSTAWILKQLYRELDVKNRLFHAPPRLLKLGATLLRQQSQFDRLFGSLEFYSESSAGTQWRARTNSAEGIHATVEWYRKQGKAS